jgi:hypothetical protein
MDVTIARELDVALEFSKRAGEYAFDRERGGPMFNADLMGLPAVLNLLHTRAGGRNGWVWTPAPLIEIVATRGARFADPTSDYRLTP